MVSFVILALVWKPPATGDCKSDAFLLEMSSFGRRRLSFWVLSLQTVQCHTLVPRNIPSRRQGVISSQAVLLLASALVSVLKWQLPLFSLPFCTLWWWYLLRYKGNNCLGGQRVLMEFCKGEVLRGSKHLDFIIFLPPLKKAVADVGQNVTPTFSVM